MKEIIHAVVGSFVLGALLGVIGFPFNTFQYWVIFIPTLIWYFSKPEEE